MRVNTAGLLPIRWYTWQLQEARSGLRASRACVALRAQHAQPHGPHKLAEGCGLLTSPIAAAETQNHSQHLAGPGSAQLGAKRGVACVVRHWRKLVVPEEPDAFIALVRVCGEGAGEPVPLPGSRLGIASACPSLRPFPAAETERWCAKRSLAFLIGGKSLRRKVSPTTPTECCACEGGANRTTRVKRTQGTT